VKAALREHKRGIAAVTAAGGGSAFVAGFGFALAVGAAVGGFYLLERARRRRGDLTG
jgi:hypothetical protein